MFKATYTFNFTKKFRQCRDGDTKEIFVWIKFKEIIHSIIIYVSFLFLKQKRQKIKLIV